MDTGNFPSGSPESIPAEPKPQSQDFSSPAPEPVSAPGNGQVNAPGQGPRPQQHQQPGKNRNRRRSRRGRHGQGRPQQSASQRNHQGHGHKKDARQGGGRQGFSGPMDHSYRQNGEANGNSIQSGNNSHNGRAPKHFGQGGGGRFRRFGKRQPGQGAGPQPGFILQPAPPELAPVAHHDDGITRIFAFIDDLFFMTKIMDTAKKLNVRVEFVKTAEELLEKTAQQEENKPSLIIIDLNNLNAKPLATIPKLKSHFKKATSILGFVSHVQGDLKLKAQEAGCDTVMPRSAFSQNLPQLLRRHGSPEELDQAE